MTWVKLDDTCPDHPAIVGLSDAAFACWVRGLCYSSRHLTDGLIPRTALRMLGTAKAAQELIAAGRWEDTPDGVRVHGYEEKQRTRGQVEQEREKWRARQDRHRKVTPESRRDTPVTHADVTPPEVETERDITPQPPAQRGARRSSRIPPAPTRPPLPPNRHDERIADLERPTAPRIPDELTSQGLAQVAALRQQLHPTPDDAA